MLARRFTIVCLLMTLFGMYFRDPRRRGRPPTARRIGRRAPGIFQRKDFSAEPVTRRLTLEHTDKTEAKKP